MPVKACYIRSVIRPRNFKRGLTYYADRRVKREFSHSEDFANLDEYIAYQEKLHLPERND
jgi:hypothetical protein